MLSSLFVLSAACLFALLFAFETAGQPGQPRLRPASLLAWLVSGNWPAKAGAGLLIVGLGALLRYALINVDVPPELKLGSGFVAVALLGAAAMVVKPRADRRAIYLALAGTAFAVAYLTAYAAYDFFHYLNDVSGLALMVVVSLAAGLFAISARAMSVAVLAMAGAYLAPKFAINLPGPAVLYGYYLAASAVTFLMVYLRGWRPLIHLSFLFTLAGGIFFAWSNRYYQPAHYLAVQPFLLALVALHLAMPVVEHRSTASRWAARFDMGYFVLLPLVAAALTLKIAPSLYREGVAGLGLLALLWAVAAVVLGMLQRRAEAARHGVVAVLMLIAAGALSATDIPWLLAGLALAVAGLGLAPRLGLPARILPLLCGAAMLTGALHIVFSILEQAGGQPFVNERFAQRAVASALMAAGAWFAIQSGLRAGRMLAVMALAWGLLALVAEGLRLQVNFVPQLVYAVLLAALMVTSLPRRLMHVAPVWGGLLLLATTVCSVWAARSASPEAAAGLAVATPLVLIFLAYAVMSWGAGNKATAADDLAPSLALGLLPLAWAPWVAALLPRLGATRLFAVLAVVLASAIVSTLLAQWWLPRKSAWYRRIWPIQFGLVGLTLFYSAALHIERGAWPVACELLALAYLVMFVAWRRQSAGTAKAGVVVIIAACLVVQATLLRLFGPDRIMDASDILQMRLPAAVSLVWATLGAGLAWWGARVKSRLQWSLGAALLALTAFKMVFRDFGTLDQLGNILAVIGAGLLFLAVAWFAPIPPAAPRARVEPRDVPEPPEPPAPRKMHETRDPHAVPAPRAMPVPRSHERSAASLAPEYEETQPSALEPLFTAPPPLVSAARAASVSAPVARASVDAIFPPPGPEPRPAPVASIAPLVSPSEDATRTATIDGAHGKPGGRFAPRAEVAGSRYGMWVVVALGLLVSSALVARSWQAQNRKQQRLVETSRAMPSSGNDGGDASIARAAQAAAMAQQMSDAATNKNAATRATAVAPLPAAPLKLADACTDFVAKLPDDYVLYSGGDYKGAALDFAMDSSGHTATRFDVLVNAPGKKVVLALGAYEPSVWNIRWTADTVIAGVFASGYHTQAVAGLAPEVPLVSASYQDKTPCGYFYLDRNDPAKADAVVRRIFGRSAETYFLASAGKMSFGKQPPPDTPFIQRSFRTVDSYRDSNAVLAGQAGLEQLIREGKLRRASESEIAAWDPQTAQRRATMSSVKVIDANAERIARLANFGAYYVVLKPMQYPSGLFGAHSVNFVVPRGVPRPQGNPGHSKVMDLNTAG